MRETAVETVLPTLGGDIGGKRLHPQVKHLRADIDDAPPLLLLHMRQHRACDEVRALDEEIEHALVKVPVVFLNRFLRLIRRGIEHHNIHRPQLLRRLSHQPVHLRFVRHVGADHRSLSARFLILRKRLRSALLVVEIIHGHLRPRAPQRLGHHLAQPGGTPRHQCHLAI